jgi:hypothetical protein
MPDLINKIKNLLTEYGLTEPEAEERARNICQAVSTALDTGLLWSWTEVAESLDKPDLYGAIADPMARDQAASESCRIVIAEHCDAVFSAWIALQRYVGDTPDTATQWLREHGYLPPIPDPVDDVPASGVHLRE